MLLPVAEERLLNILIVDDDLERETWRCSAGALGISSRASCVNSGNAAMAYLRGEGKVR